MKTLFYNIAGAITETITGLDGSNLNFEECIYYIKTIEWVKDWMNGVCAAGVIAIVVVLMYILYRSMKVEEVEA